MFTLLEHLCPPLHSCVNLDAGYNGESVSWLSDFKSDFKIDCYSFLYNSSTYMFQKRNNHTFARHDWYIIYSMSVIY